MPQTYFVQPTQYGVDLVNQHVLNGNQAFIVDGWYIALGTGNLEPSLLTTSLVNKIYDKNSPSYPGIIISNDDELGRYASLQIPSTLEGNIITEVGLYDASDKLVLSGKTKIDLTEGIIQLVTTAISLKFIPSDVAVITVNQGSIYPTSEQVTAKVDTAINQVIEITQENISDHMGDPQAHKALFDATANDDLSNLSSIGNAKLGNMKIGTCSTAAATAEKAVTATGFTLTRGAMLSIVNTTANTATSLTINANSTTAKPLINHYGDVITFFPAGIIDVMYNGTNFVLLDCAGYGTPSDTFLSVPLQASGAQYNAPCDGWFSAQGDTAYMGDAVLAIYNDSNKLMWDWTPGDRGNAFGRVSVEMSKGQKMHLDHVSFTTVQVFFTPKKGAV